MMLDETCVIGNPWHGQFTASGLTLEDGHVKAWPAPYCGYTWLTQFAGVPVPANDAGDIARHHKWKNSAIWFGEGKYYAPAEAGPAGGLTRLAWVYRAPGGAVWKIRVALGMQTVVGAGALQPVTVYAKRGAVEVACATATLALEYADWMTWGPGPNAPEVLVNHSAGGEVATVQLRFLTQYATSGALAALGLSLADAQAFMPWLFLPSSAVNSRTEAGVFIEVGGGNDTVAPTVTTSIVSSARGVHLMLTCGPMGVCHWEVGGEPGDTYIARNGGRLVEWADLGDVTYVVPYSNNLLGAIDSLHPSIPPTVFKLITPTGAIYDLSGSVPADAFWLNSVASWNPLTDEVQFGYRRCWC